MGAKAEATAAVVRQGLMFGAAAASPAAGLQTAERGAIAALIQRAVTGDADVAWLRTAIAQAGCQMPTGRGGVADQVLVNVATLAKRIPPEGWSISTVRRLERDEDLPVAVPGRGGRATLYDVFDVWRWHLRRELTKRPEQSMEGWLLGGGEASAALEQCRREKARELKRKNDEEEGQLIRKSQIEADLAEVGRLFRTEAETAEKTLGPAAGEALRRMVDEVERRFHELLAKR